MGKTQPKSIRCPHCKGYFNPPNHRIAVWFRVDEMDLRLCETCSKKVLAPLQDRLLAEKKIIKTVTDPGGKRITILTHPGDYVEGEILRPENEKLLKLAEG